MFTNSIAIASYTSVANDTGKLSIHIAIASKLQRSHNSANILTCPITPPISHIAIYG